MYFKVWEEEDRGKPHDERTMRLLQAVANSINPRLQMTIDFPSAHSNGRMPVLDFECWVGESGHILHSFDRKEMCQPTTILATSALPMKTKRAVHTQEIVRTLTRCSRSLPWAEKAAHVTRFCGRLVTAGYTAQYRAYVVTAALSTYNNMVEREDMGTSPINRPDSMDKVERAKSKVWKRFTWYRRGATPPPCLSPPPLGPSWQGPCKQQRPRTARTGTSG